MKKILSVLILMLLSCENSLNSDEDVETKKAYATSAIQLSQNFIPSTKKITTFTPTDGQGFSPNFPINFRWESDSLTQYTTLVVFKEIPIWRNGNFDTFKTLQDNCIGGASTLAGDYFFESLKISSIRSKSNLFSCDPNSNNGLISPTKSRTASDTLVIGEGDFMPGNKIYWALFELDENYKITRSSDLKSIILE